MIKTVMVTIIMLLLVLPALAGEFPTAKESKEQTEKKIQANADDLYKETLRDISIRITLAIGEGKYETRITIEDFVCRKKIVRYLTGLNYSVTVYPKDTLNAFDLSGTDPWLIINWRYKLTPKTKGQK